MTDKLTVRVVLGLRPAEDLADDSGVQLVERFEARNHLGNRREAEFIFEEFEESAEGLKFLGGEHRVVLEQVELLE